MTRPAGLIAALPLALLALAGCERSTVSSPPLGRPFSAQPAPAGAAPAPMPTGDPLAERDGTVPERQAAREDRPIPGAPAATPQAALRRYALLYVNWRAAGLPAREHQLAALAVGPARLAAEQTAASQSATAALASDHLQNTGVVVAIAPGQGPASGQWVVVTDEHTTGTGPYAGLPPSMYVTLARTERLDGGWVISSWTPRT